MSQLLVRLQQELLLVTDPVRRVELSSKVAIALARSGQFDKAALCIANSRNELGSALYGPGVLWIMVAEGVLSLYRDIGTAALDRITRAQALAIGLRLHPLIWIASAWKAHIEFENSDFEAMVESLSLAMQHEDEGDLDSVTRVAMVLANSFAFCGDFEESNRWFMRGRDSAVKNGDRLSIEALHYNKTTLRLAWLRLENCKHSISEDDIRSIRTEVRSALAFQQLMGGGVYLNHLQLCEARLLSLSGDFSTAVTQLESVRTLSPFAEHNFSQALVDIEIAYCQVRLGAIDDAYKTFDQMSQASFDDLDLDDRIAVQWMRWQMAEIDGHFGFASNEREALFRLIEEDDQLRLKVRSLLRRFVS